MELAIVESPGSEPLERCPLCSVRLVDISRKEFRFEARPCPAHRPAPGKGRLGVELGGRRTSRVAEPTTDGALEAVLEIDYLTQRLSDVQVFIEGGPRPAAAAFAPNDPFVSLQVNSKDAARLLVRRRRSRKHGFSAQVVAAYQSYLYGRDSGELEVIAFSLCSVGWRAIQRERALEPGVHDWIEARVDELISALRAEPDEHARWMPSLCTMNSQLALSRGDVDTALRYADAVLAEDDLIERCPISAYNVVLNLGLATYCRYWRDPKDRLELAMVWETLFKRIVAAMDIRFGTMYEFKVIYEVLFMVTRLTHIRRGHSDARLQPVSVDEFIENVFRVALGKGQRQRVIECLGVRDAEVAVAAVPA